MRGFVWYQLMPLNTKNKDGFSLIELLVVMIILGILATLITGNFMTSLKTAHDAARKIDLENIQKALESYYADNSAYPATLTFGDELSVTNSEGVKRVYMVKIPNDPKSGSYEYASTDGTSYSLYACLENTGQILSTVSVNNTMVCPINCKDTGNNAIPCVFGVSSSNITP